MNQFVDDLSALVAFPTISTDTDTCRQALDWVERRLAGLPLTVRRFERNGHPSLLLTTQKTTTPKVWLAAHIDVVPAAETLFTARRKGHTLVGRGVFDMKFAAASYIAVLESLKDKLADLNVGVMLTTDEEIGGFDGTGALLEEGYASEFCFLPDSGWDWQIEEAAKGVLQVEVSYAGRSAHGSRPWEGDNAVMRLGSYLRRVLRHFPLDEDDQEHWTPTVTVASLHGGQAANQVPDSAVAQLDIRLPREEDRIAVKEELERLAERYEHISLTWKTEGPAFSADTSHRFFAAWKELAAAHGKETPLTRSHGASDARFFSQHDIPTLLTHPGGGDLHGPSEWLDLKEAETFVEVLREWVERIG